MLAGKDSQGRGVPHPDPLLHLLAPARACISHLCQVRLCVVWCTSRQLQCIRHRQARQVSAGALGRVSAPWPGHQAKTVLREQLARLTSLPTTLEKGRQKTYGPYASALAEKGRPYA